MSKLAFSNYLQQHIFINYIVQFKSLGVNFWIALRNSESLVCWKWEMSRENLVGKDLIAER